jgi:membrane protease YdiL (CAAX protease family)
MFRLRGIINRFAVPLFFLLAYGWSWGCWLFVARILEVYQAVLQGAPTILTVSAIPLPIRIGFAIAALTATFGPAISSIILTVAIGGKTGLREFFGRIVKWRVGIRYYLAAFLIPPAMLILRFGLIILLGGKLQTSISTYSFLVALGMFINYFVRAGGQEELGFRGFAQAKLQEKFSLAFMSLVIGVLWFFWHLPLYLWVPDVPQHGQSLLFGLLAQISFCFTFTWIYNRTQSILMPMLLHATINFLHSLLTVSVSGSQSELISWIALIVPYFVLGVWLIWRDGSRKKSIPSLHRHGVSEGT